MHASSAHPDGGTNAHVQVSFEFFPPRSETLERRLRDCIDALAPLGPAFFSVTCGAGGSTRERTHATVRRMLERTHVPPAAHLTCVNASRDEIDAIAREYWNLGVRHLVALRGDPPAGEPYFRPTLDGYDSGEALVAGLREIADFEISVAGYPETHPEAPSPEAEIAYLGRKVDAGATRVITQVFFDNDLFLRFRDRATRAGIDVPLVPGILPIADFRKVARFCRACGATVPARLERLFAGLDDEPATNGMIGASVAAEQCRGLHAEGVDEFHFYTMNRPEPARAVCRLLGVPPLQRSDADRESVTRVA